MMTPQVELRDRTKRFAYRIIHLYRCLPRSTEAQIIGKQLLRSGTSVAANYRAANRARSQADSVSKMGIVVEEVDETVFWLECLADNAVVKPRRMADLLGEANQLLALFAASQRTARARS